MKKARSSSPCNASEGESANGDAWRATVLDLLKSNNCGYLDVTHFAVLGDLRVEPAGIEADPIVDKQLRMLVLRPKRLAELVATYRTD